MELMSFSVVIRNLCFCILLFSGTCFSGTPLVGQIRPGFQASQMEWVDHNGRFLLSNNSAFSLGFYTGVDVTTFVLNIIHINSSQAIWTANRGQLVGSSDKLVFDDNGNVYLKKGNELVWSTGTAGKKVTAMELMDSGNLVLLGENEAILWQSFSSPTDTLVSGQEFAEGMKLKSFPNGNNMSVYLDIVLGDLILFAGYHTPQTYWSMKGDSRRTNVTNSTNGSVHSAVLVSNSWNFYDQNKTLLWRFVFSDNSHPNALWAAILGPNGMITFVNLQKGKSATAEATRIPQNLCSVPEYCKPYEICYFGSWCQCPPALNGSCRPQPLSSCSSSYSSIDFAYIGEKLDYFALGFITPSLKSTVNACIEACRSNCSCNVLLFNSSSGDCFLFDQIGNFERSDAGLNGYVSYMKVSNTSGTKSSKKKKNYAIVIAVIIIATVAVIAGLAYIGFRYHQKKKSLLDYPEETLEEDNFFDSLSSMPIRFTYGDLSRATKNFSSKIGQGGFGSVYLGVLADGTHLAVKKLEGIGQGKKEFRAEVSIIGSIHHVHLVKLKGFCAEGVHRLLVYEFMGKGSLDKWISKKCDASKILDWNTRFNIALGTAKGLAYLHEECEVKIVHCDIKPENVLLDDNFVAKVSDFGLAKLMSREESLVYTTLRGTRGYLAPEWITNNPISEKSDVYSYGMVLLEIIGGRKNYDPAESSEKAHFPSYAFKMLEEGKPEKILDSRLEFDENDERIVDAIKVALWCVQDEMHLRPPMTKVVQMLEGLCAIPHPPISSQFGSQTSLSFYKWSSEEGTSTGPIDWSSDAFLSEVQLSGPR
ncbi:G-type lectin S-receptor-like serine/threonine-protein kinase SD2-5 isoform X2 [Syzygium oleosum]|uniref:G-type lectin S-receptor-like serine/threonine-protein kinase SD2-5 isoform X1 n=1 Tax=Syzygium oleosum TaxID=219896 RepID=UPI0011D27C6A|nr:G-type lectin S-receptor-like serine/threonine-protein kinase SD2-5 isoform X1 [Syzygium oleosum]XP_056167527.1 G-type lectin S-receptor-like serine/threonine-protein kinase SD2-5 isoform X2 [Syzygium oleosum]